MKTLIKKTPTPRRVALVGAEWEENISLRSLAAVAQAAGHRVALCNFGTPQEVPRLAASLAAGGYDLIGLSVAFQHRAREFKELARAVRDLGFGGHITCGGHVATAAWQELLADQPAVDTVVRHDGELTLLALLEALEQPESWAALEGLCARGPDDEPTAAPPRKQVDDLDALPFPFRDRPHARHVGLGFAPIIGGRGCYADCAYCCINSWHRTSLGKRLRFRSPEDIAREMAGLYHERGARIFCFHDDNFLMPRPRDTVKRLAGMRTELDRQGVGQVGMVGKCRPDQLDEGMLREAVSLGVFRLYLGIENGSEAGLKHLGRLHDLASCLRSLDLFRKVGMFACYNMLLFEPWTRFADLKQNLAFLKQATDFPSNFCRAEVYSGTRLQRDLAAAKRLRGGYLGYSYVIEDARAELAFRLVATCFKARNFTSDGVANMSTGMGYEGAVLRTFYPDDTAALEMAGEVDALTEGINLDTVEHLGRLLDFARTCDLDREERICDFAEDLATTINLADLDLGGRQRALRVRIKRFGQTASA